MMRIGVFDHMDRGDTALPQFFEDRLHLVEMYDRAGFYGYHVAEHHATPLGMAPCPGIWLAAIAARTSRLRFGPLVYLLPLYHPLKLLEEICMLDQMSNGRMMLGVGRGISPIEMEYYGCDPAETPSMYAEALEIILRGMTHKELTFEGKHYTFRNVPMEIAPLQQPHPPLWVGLGRLDAVPWAAERRINIVSNMQAAGVRAMTDRYRAEWAALGSNPADIPLMGVGRHVVVADTEKEALAIARRGYARWRESLMLLWIKHDLNIPHLNIAFPLTFDDAAAQNRAAAGTPEQVRAHLQRDIDEGGLNYLLCRFAFGDVTQEESVNSINLFTSRVMADLRPAEGMV
jgi:alkanesulfonate monooxygenase SsuD/methylene tetrahydromethanopterin reductase-like flavin-dependent oxidoreductase (luciferase family)